MDTKAVTWPNKNILVTITLVVVSILYLFGLAGLIINGNRLVSLTSGQMHPTYSRGSLLFVREIDVEKLQVGDIISYKSGSEPAATGRITGIIYEGNDMFFRTKADAMDRLDFNLLAETDINGIITGHIASLGWVSDLSGSFAGKLLILTPLLIILSAIFVLNKYFLLKR